ncbi:MAG: TonB-dependent receptor [Prevotellaceae bacterium]|nr:TonB-dependent receptor [Candidatus Colivivens equi]
MLKRLLSFMVICCIALIANAQVTTSSLEGMVTMDNEEAIGATVQAVHEPSGTRYATVTNAKGRYAISGMRVGGPYKVTISYVGFQTRTFDNVILSLGTPYELNVQLTTDVQKISEVVVSGIASKFAGTKTGAATNISSSQIVNMPTVSRSITDYTRLSPYGGNGMSFVGTDGRTANFTVDGANFNNNFGLSSNLPGGGNPISIDAIQEMQVVISPFDVRQTNFIGGGVNAITKSGTNTFKGSAYIYHRNENMRGDAVEHEQIAGAREKDRNTTYGFTLGGPIIKNKLFFFANGEITKTPTIANRWRGSEDGVADAENYISRTKNSDLEEVSNAVDAIYGYKTGSWTSFPADESNYKILARLDWNITDNHHLALRYNYTKNRLWNPPSATSMDGGTRMSGARTSQYSMTFANAMYAMDNLVHSFSLDLNSRINDKISNQLLATYSKLDDVRDSKSSEFPFIEILQDNQNYMCLGYELFTYDNAVHNTIWNIKDDINYDLGKHKILAGVRFEHQMADNVYMRNGTGYFRFKSLDDFYNNIGWDPMSHSQVAPVGATPDVVALDYAYESNPDAAARVQYNTLGFYAQDDWNILDNLKLTYGIRFDGMFFNNDDIMRNNAIYNIDYDGRHVDTGHWPDNTLTISPRVGFSWDVFGNHKLKVRGGTGLFSGRLPLVFFTNMPTNSGMVKSRITTTNDEFKSQFATNLGMDAGKYPSKEALIEKVQGLGYPSDIKPEDGSKQSTINAIASNFKMPQVWKTTIAVDYQFPVDFPLTVTGEFIFNKNINAARISDWSIPSAGGFARFHGADNRPIYPVGYRKNPQAFVLTNTSKGYGWSANVTVNAQPAEWVSLMAAYTHVANKELTGMPGSDASAAFTYIPSIEGPNLVGLHNSQYVTPDRFVASATLHDKSNNHYGIVYEAWRGGSNYSYMMANDMNSDGYNYDALYIPTDREVEEGQFRFVSNDDRDRFMGYVHNDDYLSNHQGEYAEAYSLYSPWVHRVDLSFKHDFNLNIGNTKNTLQLSFDIKNVLNLFNSSWGVSKYLNPEIGSDPRILKYEGVDAQGYPTFSTPVSINADTKTFVPSHAVGQCWYASFGIRYMFN